jgi:N utilization substance protein B
MGRRREARERALKELYRLEITGDGWSADDETAPLTNAIVTTVIAHGAEIDEILGRTVEHWSIERLALIDKLVLRIGVAELLFLPETPPKVVIDEAVEIAKKFSTEKSGSFVNGVLDRIWKSHVPDEAAGGTA